LDIKTPYIAFACEEQISPGQLLPAGETIEIPFILITNMGLPAGDLSFINLMLNAQYELSSSFPFEVKSKDYCLPKETSCNVFRFKTLQILDASNQSILLENNTDICTPGGYENLTDQTITFITGEEYIVAPYDSNFRHNVSHAHFQQVG